MKKCTICGTKIKRSNDGSTGILGPEMAEKSANYLKMQTICMDCKKDLLFASIIIPY